MGYQLKDAWLKKTKALPNGAASTTTDPIDLEHSTKGDFVAPVEFKVSAPALTTAQLADTTTVTYSVEVDDNSGFSSPSTLYSSVIVQTGAGGAGAAAADFTFRVPTGVERYVRVKATKTGAADASGASMTFEVLA